MRGPGKAGAAAKASSSGPPSVGASATTTVRKAGKTAPTPAIASHWARVCTHNITTALSDRM
jgi:hypothetical protein